MKVTWVLMLALGVVSADVGLGYHYKVPQTSYGVPSYQIGGNSGQYKTVYTGSSGSQSLSGLSGQSGYSGYTGLSGLSGLSGYQSSGYQTGGLNSASGLGSGYYKTLSTVGSNLVQPTYQYTANTGLGTGHQTQYTSSSQYQNAAVKKYQQYYQVQQQPAQVFKHFYVHAAPEEPEEVKPRAPIVLPPPQKHYKIIFVKTPSTASAPRIIAPVQPQNEEKTIVYVLVKKPEEQQEVVLPKVEQKPPSKPEVFFINYNDKQDSQAVINNIVQDYNKGQTLAPVSFSSDGYGSSHSNVHYQTPVQNDVSSGASGLAYDTSAYDINSSSGNVGLAQSNSGSIVSPISVVTSTPSSIAYDSFDGASTISTSQGVPHETYGPPKFRVN